jgi:hypothetical protein
MDNKTRLTQQEISEKLISFEERLQRLENLFSTAQKPVQVSEEFQTIPETLDIKKEIAASTSESNIFEYGLAWLGSCILLLGMIFLMMFTINHWGGMVSCSLGLASAVVIFLLSKYLRGSFPYMSYLFTICGYLLIFYAFLKLHFFVSDPVITNRAAVVSLMIVTLGAMIYHSYRIKSEFMAILGILLLQLTALFIDKTHFTLSLLVITSGLVLYLFHTFSWKTLLIISIFTIYISHITWLLSNPLMGHPVGVVSQHQNNLIYLFLYGSIFSLLTFVHSKNRVANDIYNIAIILNGLGFSFVLVLVVLAFFMSNYILIFLGISIVCLVYSIIMNYKIERKFDSSFYVNFSFMALSIAVYGNANLPGSYIFLAWQSLVVLAIAIWYRSSIIVLMNILLYVTILIAYMATSKPIDAYNISFVIISIVSARILNWKKERLVLKTDLIRNAYLVITFFAMLFMLYHAVPKNYVTVSWGLASVFYIILSVLLKNNKYRLMAIMTLLVTVFYLFIFDLSKMEIGYRIMAFIFVGSTILGVSIYYTKKLKKKKEEITETTNE